MGSEVKNMFEKWISWLFGYLDFYVYGKYPERFITLAARNGIRIWNMESGEKFSCRTSIEGYQRLRLYRRRCGVRMKIYRKHGLPFYFRKARKRSGLIIGFFVFAAVYGVLSSYIWFFDN